MKNEERQSNIELLRIILIMFILALHYLNGTYGGALNIKNISNAENNYYIVRILESLFIVAVNCFILITGYFSYKQTKIKVKKVIDLLIIVCFYNVLIYIISIITKITAFNKETFQTFLATFYKGGMWFIDIYIILYLLIPFINIVINKLSKKNMKILILILFIAFSLYPTFLANTTINDAGYGIVSFIMLYLIGAYINKYNANNKNIFIYLLIYIIMAGCTYYESINDILVSGPFDYNSIFNIIGSVSLFLVFTKFNFKSKLINSISKHTLSIYIIHANDFIIKYVYRNLLKTNLFWKSDFLILHLLVSICIIFIICLLIDIIREFVFKRTISKFIQNKKFYNYEVELSDID